jgi:hypothetical protein
MERKRLEYLKTGKTKKPTEIIVFTDGAAFICGSDFITGLQVYGYGIVVGFNSKPGLKKEEFDSSQSNSGVEKFKHSVYTKNLEKLGFVPYITYTEKFDPNDKTSPKIPMEFKIYPVDEISNIYLDYNDDIYDRFIEEARAIFDKYNDIENGECNKDNKLLFYETNECDSKLKIDKAHGGYLCGSDGKWNKSNCIAAYCDEGYILSDDRTKCYKDPCQNIELKEISINDDKNADYTIEPNNAYIFTINKNHSYYFHSRFDKFFYVFNEKHVLEAVNHGTQFNLNDKIYVNFFVNITEKTKIKINVDKDIDYDEHAYDFDDDDHAQDKKGLSAGVIALIIIAVIVVLMAIVFVFILFRRKKRLSNSQIEDKTQQLNPITE